ncbi:MAG: hypothetical protein RLZZ444_3356 [Pseudomonadota bacterium]
MEILQSEAAPSGAVSMVAEPQGSESGVWPLKTIKMGIFQANSTIGRRIGSPGQKGVRPLDRFLLLFVIDAEEEILEIEVRITGAAR